MCKHLTTTSFTRCCTTTGSAVAAMTSPAGRLAGKRCVVTAAAQGIGRATAEAFLKQGAALVVAVDVNDEKLKELDSERVERRVLDVRDSEAVKALANDYQDIDVLFNCVGIVQKGTLLETTEQEWDDSFDINVKSMFLLCKAFLPQMIRRGCGSIINVASISSSLRAIDRRCVYTSTKAAVIGLTKGVARDHVRQGIRCNVMCPSPVASAGFAERSAVFEDSEKEHLHYIKNNLMGRLASPEEVANLSVYLASDESSYHTGNVFVIDGGFTL